MRKLLLPVEQPPMSDSSSTKVVGPLSPKSSLFSPKAAVAIPFPNLVLDDKWGRSVPELIFPPTPYLLSSEEEFKSAEDTFRAKISPRNKFTFQSLISSLSSLNVLTSRNKDKSPVLEKYLFSPRKSSSSENEIGSFSILTSPRESYKSPTAEKLLSSPRVFSPVVSPKAMIMMEKNLIAEISKRILILRDLKISFNGISHFLEEIESHLSDLTNKSIEDIHYLEGKVYEINSLIQKIESLVDIFLEEYDSLPKKKSHKILYDKLESKIQSVNNRVQSLREELGAEVGMLEINSRINSPMQQEYKAI